MRSDRQGHGPLSVYADGSVATSRMKPSGSYNAALHRIDLKRLLRGFRSGYHNRNRTLLAIDNRTTDPSNGLVEDMKPVR
jgi:hypothetical protein